MTANSGLYNFSSVSLFKSLRPTPRFSALHPPILPEAWLGPPPLRTCCRIRRQRQLRFRRIIGGRSVRIQSVYWYRQSGFQFRVSSVFLFPLLILVLILILIIISLVANPVDVKTEARALGTGKTILQYSRFQCTNIIDSDNPSPPPPLLLPPSPPLIYQANILWSTTLLLLG